MKKNKRLAVLSTTAMAAIISVATVGTAFAQTGDIYNLKDKNVVSKATDSVNDRIKFALDNANNTQNLGFEYDGIVYNFDSINKLVGKVEQKTQENIFKAVQASKQEGKAEEFNQKLVVESVSAITSKIDDDTQGQKLEFKINDGKKATVEALEEAGYTVEFKASKKVFKTNVAAADTSATGEIDESTAAIVKDTTFKYQVVISKDNKKVAESALQDVTVVDEAVVVTEISAVKAVIDNDAEVVSGKLAKQDSSATTKIVVMGKTADMAANAEAMDITNKVTLTSNSNAKLSIAANGTVTLNGLTGDVVVTAKAGEMTKSLPLTIVDGARTIKVENCTVDTTKLDLATTQTAPVVAMLKDQYGDPIKATVVAADLQIEGNSIAKTEQVIADKTGKASLTVTADGANAGEGKLELKVGAVKIGEINVKVTAPGEVAKYELKLKADNEAKIDLKAVNKTTNLNLLGLDKKGLLKETVTKAAGDVYSVKSSDDKVATVEWVNDSKDIVVTGHAPGKATIIVEKTEGALVTATYTFSVDVVDTKAVVKGVTFETEIPKIEVAGALDITKVLLAKNVSVTPETTKVEINNLKIQEVIAEGNGVEIGSIKLTPVNLVNCKFEDNSIAQTDKTKVATGFINVAVLDAYGNLLAEKDVEIAIPVDAAAVADAQSKEQAKQLLTTKIAEVEKVVKNKVEGDVVGNQVQGSKVTLDTAKSAAETVLNNVVSTTQQLKDATTELNTKIEEYKAATVKELTGLIAPPLKMGATTKGSITGYVKERTENLNVTSGTTDVLTVDSAEGLGVTAVKGGQSVVTVKVKDANNHVIKVGTVAVKVETA